MPASLDNVLPPKLAKTVALGALAYSIARTFRYLLKPASGPLLTESPLKTLLRNGQSRRKRSYLTQQMLCLVLDTYLLLTAIFEFTSGAPILVGRCYLFMASALHVLRWVLLHMGWLIEAVG